MKNMAQLLRDAADIIRTRGWWQNWTRNYEKQAEAPGTEEVCLWGALVDSAGMRTLDFALRNFVEAEVLGGYLLSHFNDMHCQSADDAIALLEIAADLAEPDYVP